MFTDFLKTLIQELMTPKYPQFTCHYHYYIFHIFYRLCNFVAHFGNYILKLID